MLLHVQAQPRLDRVGRRGGDADALWAWVNAPTGRDDIGAWKRLVAQLEFRDPRRSLCAARIGELRRALG